MKKMLKFKPIALKYNSQFSGQRFLFDWKTPVGFAIAVAIQFMLVSYAAVIGACVTSLGIGTLVYGISTAKCLKRSLLSINSKAHRRVHRHRIPGQLIEALRFHSLSEQLSSNNDNYVLSVVLVWFAYFLISSILIQFPFVFSFIVI